MAETKKVVLFIFEGVTEKIALENILKKLFASNHVDVEFIGTDITSNKDVTVATIDNELRIFIREKLKSLHIDVSDIEKIIHVIDTDGGFVDERYIIYAAQQSHLAYKQNEILTKDPANTLKRNKEKTEKTNHLKNCNYSALESETGFRGTGKGKPYCFKGIDSVLSGRINVRPDFQIPSGTIVRAETACNLSL